jgi:ABC-type multidrug transport system ATPase subunit
MKAVEVNALRKVYGKEKTLAVDEVSFEVNEGEIFGLIGPDGAGKTSIFRMLTTLLLPDGGNAKVCGLDVVKEYKKIRTMVGYMPGKFSLYPDLTVEENLHFFATVFGTSVQENYHLIEAIYVQLAPFKDRRAGKLSGGMKQKLALCCALIHQPKVLFLDEPTTGVDPVSRKEFWEMLKKLKQEGISILVSTPYMDEAAMCDRIGLIQGGKLLSVDLPSQLIQKFPHNVFAVKADNMYQLIQSLQANALVKDVYAFGEYAHLIPNNSALTTSDLLHEMDKLNLQNSSASPTQATIEDCFIQLLH